MMLRPLALALVGTMVLGLSACTDNQNVNTATGAVVGGALGSQFGAGKGKTAMTVAGATAGAVVGANANK